MNHIKNEIKFIEMTSRQNRKEISDKFCRVVGTIAFFMCVVVATMMLFGSCTKTEYEVIDHTKCGTCGTYISPEKKAAIENGSWIVLFKNPDWEYCEYCHASIRFNPRQN